jgi:hypothetical protein
VLHVEHPTPRRLIFAKQARASGQRSGALGLQLGEMTTVVLLACAIWDVERRCEISFARMRRCKRRSHVIGVGRPGRNLKAG